MLAFLNQYQKVNRKKYGELILNLGRGSNITSIAW